MTDINHRRKNRKPVNQRHRPEEYHNGYAPPLGKAQAHWGVGKTDYLDKSLHSWGGSAPVSGLRFSASIPNDFTDGHRGMARAVRGAKKFVRTRVRFHDNAETRRLASALPVSETGESDDG
jgi:hypothetical protein